MKEGRGEDRKRESGDEGKRGREDKIGWEESTQYYFLPCKGKEKKVFSSSQYF